MASESPYPIMLSRGIARVESMSAWIRLSSQALVLFGPLLWALIAAGKLGWRSVLHRFERLWSAATMRALGVRVTIEGLENIDPHERYLIAPLHEGLIDPIVLSHLGLDLSFAARDELFSWRLLGPYLRSSDHTSISTESGPDGYRSLLRGASAAFDRNESFVAFPQGSILGIEAGFYPGPFRAAERLGHPLLPVVIAGTHRVWEYPYRPVLRRGQSVRVVVLPPISPEAAVERMRTTERHMKRVALDGSPSPRRYVPDRDGWWDSHPYRIDGDFDDLARQVEERRSSVAVRVRP